jgi:hypothetical protein
MAELEEEVQEGKNCKKWRHQHESTHRSTDPTDWTSLFASFSTTMDEIEGQQREYQQCRLILLQQERDWVVGARPAKAKPRHGCGWEVSA